jgi:hypothetical protein
MIGTEEELEEVKKYTNRQRNTRIAKEPHKSPKNHTNHQRTTQFIKEPQMMITTQMK